jgi:hypothetical protein
MERQAGNRKQETGIGNKTQESGNISLSFPFELLLYNFHAFFSYRGRRSIVLPAISSFNLAALIIITVHLRVKRLAGWCV